MNQIQNQLLAIVRYQLFGGDKPNVSTEDVKPILKEAAAQTVFTTVFPFVREGLRAVSEQSFARAMERFSGNAIANANNFFEHAELHALMKKHGIPYCALKGLASAYYYPEASLRDMGDVDFLVRGQDFERAKEAVLSAGFEIDHGEEDDKIHIAFSRRPASVWEQHRRVNGIPGGAVGEIIASETDRIIDTAEQVELDGAVCMIPDAFHHGLIMLLHVIAHMTSEGIGLRHLCDWAVFAEKIPNGSFMELFEQKLRKFGLWKFAQILTLTSEKYLGTSHREWSENSEIDDAQLEDFITDILNGGNFGKKDVNRYREIKYISNRGEGTVDSKNVVSQAFGTLNQKVRRDHKHIGKHTVLLPLGWVAEGGKYAGMLITGKRKTSNTSAMLKEAAKRKDIYSKMDLFEAE